MKNLSSMQYIYSHELNYISATTVYAVINFSYFEPFRRKLCIPTDTSIVHLHNIGNLSSSHKYIQHFYDDSGKFSYDVCREGL